jgi:hypothetical protein
VKAIAIRTLALSLSFALPLQALAQTRSILPEAPLSEPIAAPDVPSAEAWPALDAWLSERIGIQPEPSSLAEWKDETTRILRAEPGRALESAVVEAYAKARKLRPEQVQLIDRALAGAPHLEPVKETSRLLVLQGRIFEDRADGFFETVDGAERKVDDLATVEQLEELRTINKFNGGFHAVVSRKEGPFLVSGGLIRALQGGKAEPAPKHPIVPKEGLPADNVVLQPAQKRGIGVYFGEPSHELPNGIWKFAPQPPAGWREAALSYAGTRIATAPEPAAAFEQGTDSSIMSRGRSIFSALASRVGFGFGEPPAIEPVWTELSTWIERYSRIKIEPSSLRRETAEAIRTELGLRLEQALARAAVKVSGVDPKDAERLERFVSSEGMAAERFGFIHWAGEIDGKFYVKGASVYEVKNDGSLKLVTSTSFGWNVNQDSERRRWKEGVHAIGGEHFLLTQRHELLRGHPAPTGWKESALRSLASEFERAGATLPGEGSKLAADGSGNIVSRGRTIFSGFVSRLGFGFGPDGAWDRLADAVGLPLRLADHWRRKVVDFLRSEPGLAFDEVLARALPEADPVRNAAIQRNLKREVKAVLTGMGSVHQIKSVNGELLAATEKGLLRLDGGEWTPILPDRNIWSVEEIGGRLYIAEQLDKDLAYTRVFSRGPGEQGWKKELSGYNIHDVVDVAGRPLALGRVLKGDGMDRDWVQTRQLKTRAGWSRPLGWGRMGDVRQTVQAGGRTYAVAERGLFVYGKWGWSKVVPAPDPQWLRSAAVSDGRLYISTMGGVFETDGRRLTPLPKFPGDIGYVDKIVSIKGRLFAVDATAWAEFFERKDGGWASSNVLGGAVGAAVNKGRRYLFTRDEIYFWPEASDEGLPKLKREALEEASASISEKPDGGEAPKLAADESGHIMSGGRTIFSP